MRTSKGKPVPSHRSSASVSVKGSRASSSIAQSKVQKSKEVLAHCEACRCGCAFSREPSKLTKTEGNSADNAAATAPRAAAEVRPVNVTCSNTDNCGYCKTCAQIFAGHGAALANGRTRETA